MSEKPMSPTDSLKKLRTTLEDKDSLVNLLRERIENIEKQKTGVLNNLELSIGEKEEQLRKLDLKINESNKKIKEILNNIITN